MRWEIERERERWEIERERDKFQKVLLIDFVFFERWDSWSFSQL